MRTDGCLKLHLLQQAAEITPVDVKGFVECGEGRIEILLAEADAQRCRQVCRLVRVDRRNGGNMRVVAPGKLVKQQAEGHQNAGIEADRHERKQQPPAGDNRPAKLRPSTPQRHPADEGSAPATSPRSQARRRRRRQ